MEADVTEYSCGYCQLRFSSDAECCAHVSSHLNDTSIPTLEQPQPSQDCVLTDYKIHMLSHAQGEARAAMVVSVDKSEQENYTATEVQLCMQCGLSINPSEVEAHLASHAQANVLPIQGLTGEKVQSCPHCCQFFSANDIVAHIATHTEEEGTQAEETNDLMCTQCGQIITISELETHSLTHNGEATQVYTQVSIKDIIINNQNSQTSNQNTTEARVEQTLLCTECRLEFRSSAELDAHMAQHPGEKLYMCSACNQTIASTSDIKAHMLTHMADQQFVCSTCGNEFNSDEDLQAHSQMHDSSKEKTYVCVTCGLSYSSKGELEKHMDQHVTAEKAEVIPESKPVCQEIPKLLRIKDNNKFSDRSDALANKNSYIIEKLNLSVNDNKKDLSKSKSNKPEQHICMYCKKVFKKALYLKTHLVIHTGERPHQCNICSKSFKQASHLRTHMNFHAGSRPHKCPRCNKGFTTRSDLKRHMLTYTSDKKFTCDDCGKGFHSRGDLKKHRVYHSGERPFACTECTKCYSTLSDLNRHKKSHTGERPHVCVECGKAFSAASDLKMHTMIHTGKRPHACSQCTKAFTTSTALRLHLTTHSGIKKHTCTICDKGYNRLKVLENHMRTHHAAKNNNNDNAENNLAESDAADIVAEVGQVVILSQAEIEKAIRGESDEQVTHVVIQTEDESVVFGAQQTPSTRMVAEDNIFPPIQDMTAHHIVIHADIEAHLEPPLDTGIENNGETNANEDLTTEHDNEHSKSNEAQKQMMLQALQKSKDKHIQQTDSHLSQQQPIVSDQQISDRNVQMQGASLTQQEQPQLSTGCVPTHVVSPTMGPPQEHSNNTEDNGIPSIVEVIPNAIVVSGSNHGFSSSACLAQTETSVVPVASEATEGSIPTVVSDSNLMPPQSEHLLDTTVHSEQMITVESEQIIEEAQVPEEYQSMPISVQSDSQDQSQPDRQVPAQPVDQELSQKNPTQLNIIESIESLPDDVQIQEEVSIAAEIAETAIMAKTPMMIASHVTVLETTEEQELGKSLHRCEDCGKGFEKAYNLRRHRATVHTRHRPFICPHCERSFSKSSNLKLHVLIHSGSRPHVCSHCDQAFNRRATLTKHMRTHTGEKPHGCGVCGKLFASLSSVKRHVNTHTGQRPYICRSCGRGFTQSGHLRAHERTHTNSSIVPVQKKKRGRTAT